MTLQIFFYPTFEIIRLNTFPEFMAFLLHDSKPIFLFNHTKQLIKYSAIMCYSILQF